MADQKKLFSCSYCQKAFEHNSRLERHLRCHTNERPFACDFCGRAFKESGHATKHMSRCSQSTHMDEMAKAAMAMEKLHHCSKCDRAFRSLEDLAMHRTLAHPQIFTKRCECGLRVASEEINSHRSHCAYLQTAKKAQAEKRKRALDTFPCNFCGRAFRSFTSLRHHEQWEHKDDAASREGSFQDDGSEVIPRIHRCKACGKSFQTAEMLRHHVEAVHALSPGEPYMSRSSFSFASIDEPKGGPMRGFTSKRLDCNRCGLWFRTAEGLHFHSLKHSSGSSTAPDKVSKRPWSFSAMYRKTSRPPVPRKKPKNPPPSSKLPESVHSSDTSSIVSSLEDSDTLCTSNVDSQRPSQKQVLRRLNQKYMRGEHFSSGDIYLCRYTTCFLAFPSSRELARHEAIHNSPMPYLCGACDTPSTTRQQHDRHFSKCGTQSLLNHPCGSCGLFFAERKALSRHQDSKDHRPGSDACQFTCGHCGKLLPSRTELNRHNKSNHQIIEPCLNQKAKAILSKSLSVKTPTEHKRSPHPSEPTPPSTARSPSPDQHTSSDDSDQEEDLTPRKRRKRYLSFSMKNRSSPEKPVTSVSLNQQHICHICGKVFSPRRELRRHLRESCGEGTILDQSLLADEESVSSEDSDSDIQSVVEVKEEVIAIP